MRHVTAIILLVLLAADARAAKTYQVGPGKPYADLGALPALAPGDVVEVDGNHTYPAHRFEDAGARDAKITIRGVRVAGKRPLFSGGANTIEAAADHMVFEGLELTGGSSRCFYHHADDITLRDSVVHDCPAHGILGADSDSGSLLLEYVEVHHSGGGDRLHQIYMASDDTRFPQAVFRMQFCWVHDANGGNGVKSRAARNEIYYNWIESSYYHELELIGADGQPEAAVREDSDVVGNVFRKGGLNPDHFAVRIGGDGTGQSWGRYRFVNNTFISAAGSSAVFRLFDGLESFEADNNVLYRAGGGAVAVYRDVEAEWLDGTRRISGANNWVSTGSSPPAEWTGTRTGADPRFENLGGNDLRPVVDSMLVNAGAMSPAPAGAVVGHALPAPLALPLFVPARALLAPGTAAQRPAVGTIDIGALEQGSGPPIMTPDAGPGPAGPDGGPLPDGGAPAAAGDGGCSAGGRATAPWPALLLLPLALRRRRR